MKKKHLERLKAIPGIVIDSGCPRLSVAGCERIGRDYDAIISRAFGPDNNNTRAEMLGQVAEQQNQMLAKLGPMVEGILSNKSDPRAESLQFLMNMLGGLPATNDVEAIKHDIESAPPSIPEPPPPTGLELELADESEVPTDSVKWLADNFSALLPGIIESAKYAYGRLAEESLGGLEEAAYLVEAPTEQDYLDRVRVQSIEVFPERRYIFTFETLCGHLDEHGMYAVFEGAQLLACGEYDEIAEYQDSFMPEEDDE